VFLCFEELAAARGQSRTRQDGEELPGLYPVAGVRMHRGDDTIDPRHHMRGTIAIELYFAGELDDRTDAGRAGRREFDSVGGELSVRDGHARFDLFRIEAIGLPGSLTTASPSR